MYEDKKLAAMKGEITGMFAERLTKAQQKKLTKMALDTMPGLSWRKENGHGLEDFGCDDYDFEDVSIWSLRDALTKAFEYGKQEGLKAANKA